MLPPRIKFRGQSLQITVQEKLILLADLSRLVKCPRTFFIQTTKMTLDFANVELKILTNEVSKFLRRIWVARNVGSCRRNAGLCPCPAHQGECQDDSPRKGRTAQPEVSCAPYFLECIHDACLMGARPQYSRNT